jgi:hypothetical protein
MDRDEAADRLRHLAADSAERSKSAQLEDLFHEIEDALEAGVSQATILEEFRAMGSTSTPSPSAARCVACAHANRNDRGDAPAASVDANPVRRYRR